MQKYYFRVVTNCIEGPQNVSKNRSRVLNMIGQDYSLSGFVTVIYYKMLKKCAPPLLKSLANKLPDSFNNTTLDKVVVV